MLKTSQARNLLWKIFEYYKCKNFLTKVARLLARDFRDKQKKSDCAIRNSFAIKEFYFDKVRNSFAKRIECEIDKRKNQELLVQDETNQKNKIW